MSIRSIRIVNLLSFKDFYINSFSDINCIIGKNNVGKSNLLKIIKFFYNCLEGISVIPLPFHSNYSSYGEITIDFDTNRLEDVVRSTKGKSPYQKHIYKTLFKSELNQFGYLSSKDKNKGVFSLTLRLHKNNAISWSDKDRGVRDIIARIYPFLYIDTRKVDLYNWDDVWAMVSKLKFLNTKNISRENLVNFIDDKVSNKSNSYKEYVNTIRKVTKAVPYNYRDLILNYIKVGLDGHTFNINGYDLSTQSDGTNSYQFLEIFLHLVIMLTRREFITPSIFIDEPEIGLHPKKNEEFIERLHHVYRSLKNDEFDRVEGKYKNPNPKILFATHSPNILKTVIRYFNHEGEHSVYHFSMLKENVTACSLMKSTFEDSRFLSIFNDNESRLFFSDFILFVEGETELELFGNLLLKKHFPILSKIDVFKTNEVILKAINPSRANVSIPYLILYDADKMVNINPANGKIDFLKKEVNLHEINRKYKYSFWRSQSHNYKRRLAGLISFQGKGYPLNNDKTTFTQFNIEGMIERINRVLIESERTMVLPTTIEGSLINRNSLSLFLKWLRYEFDRNVSIGTKGDPNFVISSYVSKSWVFDVFNCFKAIFGNHKTNCEISPGNLSFSEQVKSKFLKQIILEFRKEKVNKSELIIILRLAFDGKTDTLYSVENKNYQYIGKRIKALVSCLKDNLFPVIPGAGKKTGGWVTSFIDFAFAHFNENSASEYEVRDKFTRAFPELNSIIKEVSSLIE